MHLRTRKKPLEALLLISAQSPCPPMWRHLPTLCDPRENTQRGPGSGRPGLLLSAGRVEGTSAFAETEVFSDSSSRGQVGDLRAFSLNQP